MYTCASRPNHHSICRFYFFKNDFLLFLNIFFKEIDVFNNMKKKLLSKIYLAANKSKKILVFLDGCKNEKLRRLTFNFDVKIQK